MDLNLDTLKSEILDYLDSREFAIFHGSPGNLEGVPTVSWDTEKHPDYQMFLETARKAGVKLILFASREFDLEDMDDLVEQIGSCGLTREEQRDYESRLREMRAFEGVTCSIELAFDYNSRLYVYQVQPDWYDEYVGIEEEIFERIAGDEAEDGDSSLGGYFSKN